MDTLEVSVSRIVTSFNQSLETSLHQGTNTAAQYSLLTEQVSLCLSSESCLQNAGSCAADTQSISQSHILCFACVILLNSYQTRNTLACLILGTYSMSRSLRSDHGNVNEFRRFDASEVDVETMSEHQHIALFQVRLDIFFVQLSLFLIVDQDHDDISQLCSLCCCVNFEALCFSFSPGSGSFVKTDNNVASGIFQVQCMCMTLAAVSDDGDRLAIQ